MINQNSSVHHVILRTVFQVAGRDFQCTAIANVNLCGEVVQSCTHVISVTNWTCTSRFDCAHRVSEREWSIEIIKHCGGDHGDRRNVDLLTTKSREELPLCLTPQGGHLAQYDTHGHESPGFRGWFELIASAGYSVGVSR